MAQWIARPPPKGKVAGSNPARDAIVFQGVTWIISSLTCWNFELGASVMPDINIPNMISIVAEKNIDSAKVRAFIPLAEKDSKQAKSYLREQLQFNDQEINLIMRQKNYCTKL